MAKKHRILVVGTGSIGERHLRCLLATGRVTVSICELDEATRDRMAASYEVEKTFQDLEEALEDKHDAAFIATPAHLHIAMAKQVVQAGLHVFIEKPLSTQLEGIEDLMRWIAQEDRIAAVGYVYRHYPMLTTIKKAIDEERFGTPLHLTVVSGQHFPTYRPAYKNIYYADPSQGGGAIQDALTHLINAGQWLVGPVDRVTADADHLVLEGVTVEDTVNVLARHGKVLASYSLNQHQAPNEMTLTLVCENGTVRAELHKKRWGWMTCPDEAWQYETWSDLGRDDAFILQANAFLDGLEGKGEIACSIEEGLATLQCTLGILAAVKNAPGWQSIPQSEKENP